MSNNSQSNLVEQCLAEFEKGYMSIFNALQPMQREYIRVLLDSYIQGDTALADALYGLDYDHKRVSPEVFFTHADYLGHFKNDIYEAWWPHILKMTDPNNKIFEIILTGSFGIGKTTVGSGLVLAYFLHKVLCLKDPAKFFGLGKKSKIVFGIYSLSLQSAEDAGFFVLRDQILAESPFFNDVYRRKPFGDDNIIFPKNLEVRTGSKVLHAAGKNLFAVCVDEMNLMAQGESTLNKAFKLANAVSRRLESRFMQRGGDIPGACIFLGSAASEASFLEQRVKAVKGKKGYYVVRGALWDFVIKDSGGHDKYCGQKFRVQVGNKETDSKILDKVAKVEDTYFVNQEDEPDLDCKVVMVPVEHYDIFNVDIEGSLQDIAGESLSSSMRLISSVERIKNCVNKELQNPFRRTVLPSYIGGGLELANELLREQMCRVVNGVYMPKINPEAPRYIHVDLAKNNDYAGVTMVHPSSHYISIEDTKSEDGVSLYDIHKTIQVDFAIAVCCGPKKESIDFANIRRLLFFIRRLGFWVRRVTYDSWQSEDSIQRLTDAGISADIKSVDKDHMPYMMLRNMITAKRISMPNIARLITELFELEFDPVTCKVDHPEDGSKDIADSLAGASFACLTDKIKPSDAIRQGGVKTKKSLVYQKYLSALKELIDGGQ